MSKKGKKTMYRIMRRNPYIFGRDKETSFEDFAEFRYYLSTLKETDFQGFDFIITYE